jgi:hypothetical protein
MKAFPLSLLALCLVCARAQSQTDERADIITGRVTDLDGHPIENALVGATASASGATRTYTTAADGRYKIYFPGTSPEYSLQVKRMGFAPVQRTVKRRTNASEQMTVDVQLGGTPLALSMVEINGEGNAPLQSGKGVLAADISVPNPIAIIVAMRDTLHLSAVQIVGLGYVSDTLQAKNSRIYQNIRTLLSKAQAAGDATQMAGSVAMMLEEASRNTTDALVAAGKLLRPEQWAILPADIRDRNDGDKIVNQ